MKEPAIEQSSFDLACELQILLAGALNSLAGKTTSAEVTYLVWAAIHINKMVAGYCELRKQRMTYASKIMIRPVMEATVAVIAVFKQKGFFFQKAYSEYEEDKTLLREFRKNLETTNQPLAKIEETMRQLEQDWDQFVKHHDKAQPSNPKNEKKLRFADILRAANSDEWYAQYRLYSQLIHGTVRAASGHIEEMTDSSDNIIILWSTLIILDHLQSHAPVELPDLTPFRSRAEAFLDFAQT